MRFATYEHHGAERVGVIRGDVICPLSDPGSLAELVARGTLAYAAERADVGTGVDIAEVRLLPPLLPPSIRDFITFEQHVVAMAQRFGDEVPDQWYQAPAFYFTNPHALIGAHDPVAIPPGCAMFDFELEVAAVIGRAGRDLTPRQARDHIVGYTILNDWSARDVQAREMTVHLGPAKGKDSATTLGPWLVTSDELEPYRDTDGMLDIGLTVAVNDVVGRDRLANMAWTFEEMVAYASRGAWVRPGDVLGSGTCGSGCLAELWAWAGTEHPPPLRPYDTVTITVEGIGVISNTVVAGAEPVAIPPARRRPRLTGSVLSAHAESEEQR